MKKTTERVVAAAAAVWLLYFSSLPLLVKSFAVQATTSRKRISFLFASSSSSADSVANKKNVVLENIKILILPGFGNDSNDYYLEQAPQGSLVRSLEKRGWKNMVKDETAPGDKMINEQIRVLPLSRLDWLQVFLKGALDVKFWMADAAPSRPAFNWYLQRIATAVEEMTTTDNNDDENNNNNNTKVVLVCHSAGGWLARACLGFLGTSSSSSSTSLDKTEKQTVNVDATNIQIPLNRILGVVTLGAPHLPPPPHVMDMTRGALRITHETFPGAYHNDDIFYITVAGNAVRGEKQERQSPWEPTTVKGFAYNSYEAVIGDGTALGDGVVPVSNSLYTVTEICYAIHSLCWSIIMDHFSIFSQSFCWVFFGTQVDAAHLEDAIQIDLEGIFHSINAPDQWYGSDAVIDSWHDTLMEEIVRAQQSRQETGHHAQADEQASSKAL